jgi:hypothetical protein
MEVEGLLLWSTDVLLALLCELVLISGLFRIQIEIVVSFVLSIYS